MKKQNKILIILVIGILTLNSCSAYRTEKYNGNTETYFSGKIGNINYQTTYIKTNKFEGVIFPKEYIVLMNSSDKKFTPTISDIESAEKILQKGIKEINVNRPNQFDNCPVIHRKLKKYKRQYFGYFDTNGDKIIFHY